MQQTWLYVTHVVYPGRLSVTRPYTKELAFLVLSSFFSLFRLYYFFFQILTFSFILADKKKPKTTSISIANINKNLYRIINYKKFFEFTLKLLLIEEFIMEKWSKERKVILQRKQNNTYIHILYIYIYLFFYLVAVKEHYCLLGRLKPLLISMRLQKSSISSLLKMNTIYSNSPCIYISFDVFINRIIRRIRSEWIYLLIYQSVFLFRTANERSRISWRKMERKEIYTRTHAQPRGIDRYRFIDTRSSYNHVG